MKNLSKETQNSIHEVLSEKGYSFDIGEDRITFHERVCHKNVDKYVETAFSFLEPMPVVCVSKVSNEMSVFVSVQELDGDDLNGACLPKFDAGEMAEAMQHIICQLNRGNFSFNGIKYISQDYSGLKHVGNYAYAEWYTPESDVVPFLKRTLTAPRVYVSHIGYLFELSYPEQ